MMRLIIVFLTIFLTLPAFAKVNPYADGYEYVTMSAGQKTELVDTLYMILKIDKSDPKNKVENGVNALDGLYFIYFNEMKDKPNAERAIQNVFGKPVMAVLAEIFTQPDGGVVDKSLLEKYNMHYSKDAL